MGSLQRALAVLPVVCRGDLAVLVAVWFSRAWRGCAFSPCLCASGLRPICVTPLSLCAAACWSKERKKERKIYALTSVH